MRSEQGFTLLEIMLVVVLIGLTVTFVNLNLQPDPQDRVKREGQRIAALLNQLQAESVLSGRPMAMEMDQVEQSYRFLELEKGEWAEQSGDDVFRERTLSTPIKAKLIVENTGPIYAEKKQDDEETVKPANPKVVVEPVGAITPFVLSLTLGENTVRVTLDEMFEVAVYVDSDDS